MYKKLFADPAHRYRRALFLGFGGLLALSALGLALMLAALSLQDSARAYLAGESHWSKGVTGAVYYLDRYAETADPHYRDMAVESLQVPLGDLRARRALDRHPPDLEVARQGLLQGNNAAEDIPGMIRLYRHFSWAPYFREAVAAWRESDGPLLRMREIADELRTAHEQGDPQRIGALREEIREFSVVSRQLANTFSARISEAIRVLRGVLVIGAVLAAVFLTLISYAIFYRMLEWLRVQDRHFRAAYDQAGVGMARVSLDGVILDANRALCTTLQMPRDRILDRPLSSVVHPDDTAISEHERGQLLEDDTHSCSTRKRFVRADGSILRIKMTTSLVRDEQGRPEQFMVILEDITAAHELAAQLSHQAQHDELTGLINRREIERRVKLALDNAWRNATRHVLCVIDLDQFKVVNDSCGHLAGDHLLRRTAELLGSSVRQHDVLGRLGSDEFALILYDTDLHSARRVAEKIRAALGEFVFRWEDRTFTFTATIGLAEIGETETDVTSLMRNADTACHLAKELGGDRIHVYAETDQAIAHHYSTLDWLGSIREALESNRFRLAAQILQPLFSHDEPLHYEVLVRLVDRDGREYEPASFLPAAERYGLVTAIDREVVEQLLAFLHRNPEHLEKLGRCHINASGPSISSQEYRDFVAEALHRYGIPGHKICFEITETAAMANLDDAWRFFEMAGSLGCCIALDDFGSGLSSFNYLKTLPVDILKIDGAFVRDITSDSRDHAVVHAINEVGKALGKITVAEFVESTEALAMLRALGVDFAQGYGIHKPCPLESLVSESTGLMPEFMQGSTWK